MKRKRIVQFRELPFFNKRLKQKAYYSLNFLIVRFRFYF